jgi:hypothetical protein
VQTTYRWCRPPCFPGSSGSSDPAASGKSHGRTRRPSRCARRAWLHGICAPTSVFVSFGCINDSCSYKLRISVEGPCGAVCQSRADLSQRALVVPYQPGPFFFGQSVWIAMTQLR